MAEDTPTASAPAGEPAPAEPAPETSQEKGSEKDNEPEKEKPSDKDAAENKEKPASEAPAAEGATDAKKSEEGAAAPDSTEAEAAPQAEANGTPASSKKGGSSKRKSSGGIPEHKSKQNRRKSHVNQVHAKPGEYYLARLRSFPPWPSIICDDEILPQSLLDTRPVSAYRPDGTIREDYAEGGKRGHERTYPVMFFQTNEFAWVQNTCLSPTDPESCKNVSEKSKSKLLLQAYAVAAEGNDLEHFKKLLSDHEHALEQELAAQEEAEKAAAEKAEKAAAEKAEKASKKNKRKSMDIADDGADDIEMGEAEGSKKSKSTKKRKKDDDEADKPSKNPKTGTKLKLTTPKTPASEGGKKSSGSKSKQPAGGKKGDKAATSEEDEEDTGAEAKAPKKQMTQQEAKAKREKEILFIRHKLQKGFISRDQPPKEEEMTSMSSHFSRLEAHKDLEVAIIRHTKINKVLKMIVKLNSIPRDEEFQFRKRAMDMLSQWKNDLELDTTITPGDENDKDDKADGKEKEAQPKANGASKEDSIDTPTKGETEGEKAKGDTNEPLDEPMTDADAEQPKSSDEKAASKGGEEKAEDKTKKAAEFTEEKGKPAEKEGEAEKPSTEEKETEKTEEKTEAAA